MTFGTSPKIERESRNKVQHISTVALWKHLAFLLKQQLFGDPMVTRVNNFPYDGEKSFKNNVWYIVRCFTLILLLFYIQMVTVW